MGEIHVEVSRKILQMFSGTWLCGEALLSQSLLVSERLELLLNPRARVKSQRLGHLFKNKNIKIIKNKYIPH